MPERTCSVDGCDYPVKSRGLCGMHYARLRRHGDPTITLRKWTKPRRAAKRTPTCSIEGCEKLVEKRGWCSMHNRRWEVHGDPHHDANRGPIPRPVHERILERVTEREDGCWIYDGYPGRDRAMVVYGSVTDGTRAQDYAYRVMYREFVGPIPDGMVIHHRCENGRCVNPAHLEPLERGEHTREHVRRAEGPCRTCGADEWRYRPTGRRDCVPCKKRRARSSA